jgi:hypothetical protein
VIDMNEEVDGGRSVSSSIRRIAVGLLFAIPTVAGATGGLMFVPSVVALTVGICGVGLFMASETFESKPLAGLGGVLMFSGVLAWALRQ